ncbi:hypothetical protein RUND412_007488 [Rhizina undulata]
MAGFIFKAEDTVPIPSKDILSWMFDEKDHDPHKKIYVDAKDTSRCITYAQAKSVIRKLVEGFHDAGLKKGDCVLVHSFNDIYYSILFLGIIAAGGVYTGTNPSYTPAELSHHIEISEATFIISEPEVLQNVLLAAEERKIPPRNIWIFNPLPTQVVPPGHKSWEELLQHGEKDWVRFDDEKISAETGACRLFSSGTTGLPKAVELSHRNLVAQHTMVTEYRPRKRESVFILPLPMFHAACVPHAHISNLRMGWTAYVLRRFDLELYLSTVQNHGITELTLIPPLVVALVMSPLTKKYSLTGVHSVRCGAAPLSKEMQARFLKFLDPAKKPSFTQVWGMTETSCVATKFWNGEYDDTGSVGRLVPNLEAKLVDESGKNISEYDVPGELCIRGPIIVRGYFNNPEANRQSHDSDGFFHTGDIAICEGKSKKWYIVDRKKELIKVRGFQVAPPELEAVLLSHPQIVDAAVIGITLNKDGLELPRAYVVRRPGKESADLNETAVKEYVAGRVATYKRLEGGVQFLPSIPKNASGKILKRVLREMAKEELVNGRSPKASL